MDPLRGAGHTQGGVEDKRISVGPTREPTEAPERGKGDAGQAPETSKTAAAKAAADVRTPKGTGAAETTKHNDKGSAGTVTTEERQEETRTKAKA